MCHLITKFFHICVISFPWLYIFVILLLHIGINFYRKRIWMLPLLCIMKQLSCIDLLEWFSKFFF